jgi:hypothetical protein
MIEKILKPKPISAAEKEIAVREALEATWASLKASLDASLKECILWAETDPLRDGLYSHINKSGTFLK